MSQPVGARDAVIVYRARPMLDINEAMRSENADRRFQPASLDARKFGDLVIADIRKVALVVAARREQKVKLHRVQFGDRSQLEGVKRRDAVAGIKSFSGQFALPALALVVFDEERAWPERRSLTHVVAR